MASTKGKKERCYAQSILEEAVRMVKAKEISLSQASVKFNIPKGTLHNKIHGKTPIQCRKGPETLLSKDEEYQIATWILNMAKVGYPVSTDDVRETVRLIFESKGQNYMKPGKKWMRLFLNRHSGITKRHAEIISKARASITEPMIRKWFEGLRQHLQEETAEDILNHPERIFNLDETGVQLCPKTGVVLAPKNYRSMYTIASGQEKQCITVLCNFSASGETVPPFIVYPLQRISKEVAQSVPDDWGIGRTDSGWMTGQTFFHYIKELFVPWLKRNNVPLPILLLVDGHKSHINMELHEFCVEQKIILYCLLPNTTHILQPCDVGIFGPLKSVWRTTVRKHKLKQNDQLTRSNFAKVFSQSFNNSITENIIRSGFKACGIFPFNPDAVDYTRCLSNRREEIEKDIPIQDYTTTINVIEKSVNKKTLDKYNEYRRCNKKVKSTLFQFWNKCKSKIDNTLLSKSSYIDDSVTNTSRTENNKTGAKINNTEVSQEVLSMTLGTDTIVDGILDIENMPIELEGVTYFLDAANIFEDGENTSIPLTAHTIPNKQNDVVGQAGPSSYYPSFLPQLTNHAIPIEKENTFHHEDITSSLNLTNVPSAETITTSTPVSSKTVIPLPWYDDENQMTQERPLAAHKPELPFEKSQDISDIHQDSNLTISNNYVANTIQIVDLLKLPEVKKSTKRKLSKSPMPLAITSKKFREYIEIKENEKKKKAEDICNRKILREQKKAEKEKKIKIKKTNTTTKDPANATSVAEITKKGKNSQISRNKTNVRVTKELANATPETETIMTTEANNNFSVTNKEDIKFGAYVVVEFQTNKRNRYYVGEVVMRDYESNFIKVKCVRKKASKFDNLTYFVEPSTVDLTEVSINDVKKILPTPQVGRRGMITFDNCNFNLNLCE